MENKEIKELARKAYEYVYNQSEDVIVREAISKYSDNDEIADYVESYQNIFKDGWVNFVAFKGNLNSYLSDEEKISFQKLESLLSDDFQIEEITNGKIGTVYKYIRPKEGHELDRQQDDNETKQILPELTDGDRQILISEIRKAAQSHEGHWISMVDLGASLKSSFDYKAKGYLKLSDLLSQLLDDVELRAESPVKIFVHVKGDDETNINDAKNVESSFANNYEDQVVSILEKAISEGQANSDGWLKTTVLGLAIKRNGIDYKMLGFSKLKFFLESISSIELKQVSPTELFARVNKTKRKVAIVHLTDESITKEKLSPFEKITRYAFFPSKNKETNGFTQMLQELEAKAKKENWEYGNQKILQNYLLFTFERIQYEDSRINSDKEQAKRKLREGTEYAIFNTGLVNGFFSPIYGLFRRNPQKGKQPWLFNGFYVESEKAISNAKKEENWDDLPKAARFYESPDDLIFDVESKIDAINWEHIIIDNVDRIPFKYIERYKPLGLDLEKEPNEPMIYYENLRNAIRNDQFTYRKLVDLFRDAMERAVLHATWNFHYALPMYYPRYKRVSMLLPLILEDSRNSVVELALVLDRDNKHKTYTATTIMTLEQIYCNIRLISQPDEDTYWLQSKLASK
jgi:hypothetical protein